MTAQEDAFNVLECFSLATILARMSIPYVKTTTRTLGTVLLVSPAIHLKIKFALSEIRLFGQQSPISRQFARPNETINVYNVHFDTTSVIMSVSWSAIAAITTIPMETV